MTLYTPVVFTYKACKQHIPNQEYKNSTTTLTVTTLLRHYVSDKFGNSRLAKISRQNFYASGSGHMQV